MWTKIDEICLCAKNMGQFYERHCKYATSNVSLLKWKLHVRDRILPAYQKDIHDTSFKLSSLEIERIARDLQEYYTTTLKEDLNNG